jgi:RNA polymerase sigma-70 factor (ECF subfamily)
MPPSERVGRERLLRGAVLAGDEHAWRLLYDESSAPLHAYVVWRCGGLRHCADEIVQDVWLTAVRRIRDYDPSKGDLPSWLRGIATNLLRNRFRRDRRRDERPLDVDPVAPDGRATRDRAERVAEALAALPERYEAVLRAKYLDGCSVADIAAATGDSEKAVESLLTRARQAFRETYEPNA